MCFYLSSLICGRLQEGIKLLQLFRGRWWEKNKINCPLFVVWASLMGLEWMTSETPVLMTDSSKRNSGALLSGASILRKTNMQFRQNSLPSLFPSFDACEVTNGVSSSLGESASVNLWQCLSSRRRPCWKHSRNREADQKGKQILSLEISCSSCWVCCYYK